MYRSNQLLLEISKKSHAENLLRTTLFHSLKVRVFPHTSLNSSRGVIRCPDLRNSSEEEILEGTRSQGVTAVKRFKIKRNGQLKDTNTFVFTFNTPALPKTVKVAYFRVSVEIYIPNPLRCHSCQKYGHHENWCTKDPICANCGEPANHTEQNCGNAPSCVNCGEKHSANSKECQVWHREKEILTVKFTRNISFPEARKIVESPTPIPGVSYASIAQSPVKKIIVEDAVTQTDPIPGLKPLDKLKPKNTSEDQKNNSTSQTSPQPTETNKTEKVLKNATLEMIKKDLKKQQQKQQLSQKQIISDRQRKGSRDNIKNRNRFECLSDSSDMEFENPTPRSGNNRSR